MQGMDVMDGMRTATGTNCYCIVIVSKGSRLNTYSLTYSLTHSSLNHIPPAPPLPPLPPQGPHPPSTLATLVPPPRNTAYRFMSGVTSNNDTIPSAG